MIGGLVGAGCVLGAIYLALVARLYRGLGRIERGTATGLHDVSVVIAARNEANRIDACLAALDRQSYPRDRVEVIVVDDRSVDDTAARARAWEGRLNLAVLSVPSDAPSAGGKKMALGEGIRASGGAIILTTDADCRPETDWVRRTVGHFEPHVGLVAGYAPLRGGGSPLGLLLELQGILVNALAAAGIGAGLPMTCSGRNLAFRRAAYEEVDGYAAHADVPGGDDVFLMRDIATRTAWNIRYNADPLAAVPSAAHTDHQLSRQVRYQSKTVRMGGGVLILAGVVYILNLLLLTVPFLLHAAPAWGSWFLGIAGVKITADLLLYGRATRCLGERRRLVLYPILVVLLPLYVVLFSTAGVLLRPRWS